MKRDLLPIALALSLCSCVNIDAQAQDQVQAVERVTTLATFMDCTPQKLTLDTLLRLNFPASASLRAAARVQAIPVASGNGGSDGTPSQLIPFLERINNMRRAAGAGELSWSNALRDEANKDLNANYKNSNIDQSIEVQRSAALPSGASLHVGRWDGPREPSSRCELMDVFNDWETSYPTLMSLLDYRYTRIGVASLRGGVRPSGSSAPMENTYHANFVIELGRAQVPELGPNPQDPIAVLYPPPGNTRYKVLPSSFILVQLREGASTKLNALEIRKEIWGKVLDCMFCAMPGADVGVLYDTWAHQLPHEGVIAGTTYFATAKGTHDGKPFEKSWSFTISPRPGSAPPPPPKSRFDISEPGSGLKPPASYGRTASDVNDANKTRSGKYLEYTYDMVRFSTGRLIRVPGKVFIGTLVEHLPDGQCRTLTTELVEMQTSIENGITRENPITRKTENTAPCSTNFTTAGHGDQ